MRAGQSFDCHDFIMIYLSCPISNWKIWVTAQVRLCANKQISISHISRRETHIG